MRRDKIIIISWDFFPSSLVSSRRITFWAQNLKKYLTQSTSLQIVTFNSNAKKTEFIDELTILTACGPSILKKGIHVFQIVNFLRYEKMPTNVILSAGPFYFLFSAMFIPKRHRLILDLRDPFVGDSKHKISKFKKIFKTLFQKWFICQADGFITINEYLKQNFKIPDSKPCLIIPNGLEDSSREHCITNKKIIILGKVYENLTTFIQTVLKLDPDVEFHQFVNLTTTPKENLLPSIAGVSIHDEIPYAQVPKICQNYGLALVSSYPENFVLPVKIFDYVLANQKIIVLNDKNVEETEIKRFLRTYPNCFYCYTKDINELKLKNFLDAPGQEFDISMIEKRYFRSHSTKMLAEFLSSNHIS